MRRVPPGVIRPALLAAALAAACADGGPPAITITPPSFVLRAFAQHPLTVMQNGRPPGPATPVTWTSSDTTVVVVLSGGLVIGVRSGTATVTATLPSGQAQTTIQVIPAIAGIWTGSASGQYLEYQLNEVVGPLTGNGSLSGRLLVQRAGEPDRIMDVAGAREHPMVALQWNSPASGAGSLSGRFGNDTTMIATVQGLAATAVEVTLFRPACYCPVFAPFAAAAAPTAACGCGALP